MSESEQRHLEEWAERLVSHSRDWQAKKAAQESVAEEQGGKEAKEKPEGKLIFLGAKTLEANLKLEQNLGCDFPVCVANRKNVKDDYIETATDRGTWRLARAADSLLPSPEHYPYWLWFLDRCHAAYEQGVKDAPCIVLNPPELFDLFGKQRTGAQGRGHRGFYYDDLDEAFTRFSSLIIKQRAALYLRGVGYHGQTTLGTLCNYSSWRAVPEKGQEVPEFVKGWIQPGPVIWGSIRAGYLKSCPSFERLLPLGYIAQRLSLFLAKHCQPGERFTISAAKLLPRIPMACPTNEVKRQLRPHHGALLEAGFLDRVSIEGRGSLDRIMLTYGRPDIRN